jgi:hypothetical protein
MKASAEAAHPRYISYDEDIYVLAHGSQMVRERAHVDYRDDGIALILDDRYGQDPVFTTRLEPGPPELGPYGQARAGWMDDGSWPGMRTVANVRVDSSETCTNAGLETQGGSPSYHLVFTRPNPESPGLKGLWVDASTSEIHRLLLVGQLRFKGAMTTEPADFDLQLSHVDGFNVVTHVMWSQSGWSGEYTLLNFAFPSSLSELDSAATHASLVDP